MLACYAGRHLRFVSGSAIGGWDREFGIVVSESWDIDTAEGLGG